MRARNALLAAGALATLVVAIAVFALDAPRDEAASADRATAVAERVVPAHDPRPLDGEEPRDARTQADEPRSDAAPPQADAQVAPAAPGETCDVLVVRRADHAPVAGAELAYFEPLRDDQPFDTGTWLREPDSDGRFEHAERRYVADEHGRARVPKPRLQAILVGRAREAWGLKLISRGQEQPIELVLEVDGDVLVRVVDALGKPVANVPVALRRKQFDAFNDYVLARSDAEGLARLRHGRAVVPARPRGWRVAIRGVFDPPLEAELAESPSSAPLQLVAPPFGACEVGVLDERGAACHDALSILLRVATPGADEPRLGTFLRGGALAVDRTEEARALFEPVQLGTPLEAFVQRAGSGVEHRATVVGPARAGELVHAVVRLSETGCALTGRVLDEDGAVLTEAATRARILRSDSGAPSGDCWLKLDEQGRFLYELDADDQALTRAFTVYRVDARGLELASASVALPARLATGLLDLGDLQLARSPALVSGTVFDHHGIPLSDAEIHVATPRQRDRDEVEWFDVEALRTISDADGRFDLRARLDAEQIQVTAQKDDRVSEPVFVAPGAAGVVLRMIPSGGLAGRLLFDATVFKSWGLRITANQSDAVSQEQRAVSYAQLQPDGAFAMRTLRAGTYDVNVSTFDFGGGLQVAQARDVSVEVDRVTRDPRLDPLDLRSKVRSFTLDVVDERGERVPGAWITLSWLDLGFAAQRGAFDLDDDPLHVLCGEHGVDVRAGGRGMAEVDRRGVTSDARLVLHPPTGNVRLVLSHAVELPEPPLYLAAQLQADSGAPGRTWGQLERFDRDGRVLLPATLIGRARVKFAVMQMHAGGGYRAAEAETRAPVFIEVAADTQTQEFTVQFDCPNFAEVCRELTSGN